MSASWRSSSGSPTRNGTTKTQAIVDEFESTKEEVELTALSTDGSAEESEWKGNIFQWMEAIDSTRVSSPGSICPEPSDVGVAGIGTKRARSAESNENGSEPRDKRSRLESEEPYSDSDDGQEEVDSNLSIDYTYILRETSEERRELRRQAELEDYDGQLAKLEAANRKRLLEAGLGPGFEPWPLAFIRKGEDKGD
jgi:hypothetical protein